MKSFHYRQHASKLKEILLDSPELVRIITAEDRRNLQEALESVQDPVSVQCSFRVLQIKSWLDLLACAEVEARWEENDDLRVPKLVFRTLLKKPPGNAGLKEPTEKQV